MSRLYLFEDPFENSDLDVVVDLNEIAAVEPEPKMDNGKPVVRKFEIGDSVLYGTDIPCARVVLKSGASVRVQCDDFGAVVADIRSGLETDEWVGVADFDHIIDDGGSPVSDGFDDLLKGWREELAGFQANPGICKTKKSNTSSISQLNGWPILMVLALHQIS